MTCYVRRRPLPRSTHNPFVHPLDVELLALAEHIQTDWTVWAFEHIVSGCAACECRYGRLKASL